ncbi:MAG: FAD-binding protein [Rhodobacteraceae bacterium]|nr:MAG: FAD-binding protein [Paracoccaceae bacterium]
MSVKGLEVLIVGGGVAGLAAAIALSQRGAQVLLLEQAAGFLEHGAGLQISPNGARVITALGQGAALARLGDRSAAVVLRKGASAREVLRMALPDAGPGFHLIHRADLIEVLRSGLDGVTTRMVARVVACDVESPKPSVTLEDGEVLRADLILGADGLHSVIRPALDPEAPQEPFFTGQVAWRALIPCTPDAPRVAEVFMGPGRHLVSYPLRGGRLRNIVAVEERRDWAAEGWSHPGDPAHLRRAFAGFGGSVPAWLAQVQILWLWGLFRHPVAPHWHRGPAAILGDAAHPTLPFMAQGANLALEDAYVLARALDSAPDLPAGLATYQAMRRNRVIRVVEAANRNARNYHLRAPLAPLAHLVLQAASRVMPDAPLRQFGWIYDHDVTAA